MSGTKNQRPGFLFLIGEDRELLLQGLDDELQKFPPISGNWKKTFFWGDELPDSKFWESLKQQGLFTENRSIIVRQAHKWPAHVWKALDESLARGSSSIWPFFCLEIKREKGGIIIPVSIRKSRCFNFAEKNGWIRHISTLSRYALNGYIKREAQKRKLNFSQAGLEAFIKAIQEDAGSIRNELDKLSLGYGDKVIEPDMLEIGASSMEANAFVCIRNLYSGNITGVRKEIAQDGTGSLLFPLIALLARDFHLSWQIMTGEKSRQFSQELSKQKELALRLGGKGLSQAFVLLANAEYQVKSGKLSPGQALDKLLADLQILLAR